MATSSVSGERILITGATGSVGGPVAVALAGSNEVTAVARFGDAAARTRLESAGVRCVTVDFETTDFSEVPGDYDVVLHFAVAKTNDFDRDLAANVEALGFLMARVAGTARAFLHCSSTAVYEPDGHRRFVETDALGDNHRAFGFMPTYSISKIAAEAMARYGARAHDLPTTIARLSVPYGDDFGWPLYQMHMLRGGIAIPVHADAPSEYNPIHIDDIVSIEDWAAYLAGMIGLEAKFQPTTATIASVACDVTKRLSITGPCTVSWKDGLARMAEHLRA